MLETEQQQIAEYQLALCLLLDKDSKPLIEGVREKCPRCGGYGFLTEMGGDDILCSSCQGRGWIPSTNTFKYLEAVSNPPLSIGYSKLEAVAWATLCGELATLEALAKALRGLGQ